MFASLKNKIREETGSDISKFTSKITSSTQQKLESLRGRSTQGSSSSINSIISQEGFKDDFSDIQNDEIRTRLVRIEADFARKLDQKEKEWKEILQDKDKRLQNLEKEKDEAYKQLQNYKELLKNAEETKQKLVIHQEDKEQIESFQTQELTKVKQLVLLRDKELEEKSTTLKEANHQLEKLRNEVVRLRRQEEQLSDVQQNSNTEVKIVRKNLENVECELEKTEDECSKLRISVDSEHQANDSLREAITKLEKELSEERFYSVNMQNTLARVTSEKNTALLRNAEISQQMELAKQEVRRQGSEVSELLRKLTNLQEENNVLKERDNKGVEQELRTTLAVLEEQISDKNKLIKTLQLRLSDMKKTLQQELRTPSSFNSDHFENSAAILMPSQNTTKQSYGVRRDEEDVNFKYLKHVIIKFLTCREYEAQHLTRAVATLLKFSAEEEKLLHDTLEWRMSWFGSKPKIPNGPAQKSSSRS